MTHRFFAATLLLFATSTLAHAQAARPDGLLGRNLLRNGGAEAQTDDPKKVPGWSAAEGFQVATYGAVSGEWDTGVSGCPTCGKHYLRLQWEKEGSQPGTSQVVDVGPAAADIDQGKVTATATAYVGAFLNSDTTSQIVVSFQDAAGKELGRLESAPADSHSLPKPSVGDTGLTQVAKTGAVPPGTRKVGFTWQARPTGGSGSYVAVGDNFSLVLSASH